MVPAHDELETCTESIQLGVFTSFEKKGQKLTLAFVVRNL